MKLTNQQIESILIKDVSAKTFLVDANNLNQTIEEYKNKGWEFVKQSNVGNRIKLTFRKVK